MDIVHRPGEVGQKINADTIANRLVEVSKEAKLLPGLTQ